MITTFTCKTSASIPPRTSPPRLYSEFIRIYQNFLYFLIPQNPVPDFQAQSNLSEPMLRGLKVLLTNVCSAKEQHPACRNLPFQDVLSIFLAVRGKLYKNHCSLPKKAQTTRKRKMTPLSKHSGNRRIDPPGSSWVGNLPGQKPPSVTTTVSQQNLEQGDSLADGSHQLPSRVASKADVISTEL